MQWGEWEEGDGLGNDGEEEQIVVQNGKMVKQGKAPKINNVVALKGKYESILIDTDWIETQALTTKATMENVDVNHDLNRELAFYSQAKEATATGLAQLRALGVPIERPSDYFAEMVKSDEHMEYIRNRLGKQKERLEMIEQKKTEAEARKFGKGKQKLAAQEKLREKKEEAASIKAWSKKRRGNTSSGDKELEDLMNGKKKKLTKGEMPDSVKFGKQGRGNAKKEYKLSKFASKAGKKGGWKRNDAESASKDAYSTKLHKAGKTAGKKPASKRANPSKRRSHVIQKSSKSGRKK